MAMVDPKILLAELQKVFGSDIQKLNEETVGNCLTISELLAQGKMRVKDILQISDGHMEMLYATAYNFYQDNKIEQANKIFTMLCTYDPVESKYWEGLGATLKLLKRYKEAICAYHVLTQLHALKISYYFDLAECFLKIKQPENAKKCCDMIIFMAENKTIKAKNSDAKACLAKAKNLQRILNK